MPVRYEDGPASDLLSEAKRRHKRGELNACADLYARELERDATSLDAAMNLASVTLLTGPPSEARTALIRADTLARGNARASRDLGFAWLSLGELAAAEASFARATELEPSLVGARLARCEVLLELGRTEEALSEARASVDLAPEEAAPHVLLHQALGPRDPAGAREALDQAIDLDPGWALPRFLRACGLATSGELDRAEALLTGSNVVDGLARIVEYAATLPRDVRTFTTRAGLLRHALDDAPRAGMILEFGVHHGASTRVLAEHLAATRGPTAALVGFDSFRGLPEAWQGRDAGVFSTQGEPPPLPANVELRIGLFDETLPVFLEERAEPAAFVHLDADIYSSTNTVLSALEARTGEGTVLVFDEYVGNASWEQDEHRAFEEFTSRTGLGHEVIAVNWITGQAAFRLVGARRPSV